MNSAEPGEAWFRATQNNAEAGSYVENQAQEIIQHNYFSSDGDDTAQRRFEIGRRYLGAGSPREAEVLIREAIHRGYETSEAHFHWVLAMFSKRSFRDLGSEERDRLEKAPATWQFYPEEDRYARALEPLSMLIHHLLGDSEVDTQEIEEKVLALDPDLYDKITRHLDEVLGGVTQQRLWDRTLERAQEARLANDRKVRARYYFEPIPAKPRKGAPRPGYVAPGGNPAEVTGIGVFVFATLALCWLTLSSGDVVAIVALAVFLPASGVVGREAFQWRYRADRATLNEERHEGTGIREVSSGDEKGFVGKLRNSVRFYFAKYRPADVTIDEWLDSTAGIREGLCAELAETYREQRTPVDRINWLLRYHAIEAKKSFDAGTFHAYGVVHQVEWQVALRFAGCLVAAVCAGVILFRASTLGAQLVLVVSAASGSVAVAVGYRLYRAWRSSQEDEEEAEALKERRMQEFDRWSQKVRDLFPSEREMETWLLSDITVLIGKVLREGNWKRSDIISHAVLRQPGTGWSRRCVSGGPWRYSKYQLRIYLVTVDGLREVTADLDFKTGNFGEESRENFQLDNITSVKVTEEVGGGRVLAVMLNNGDPRTVRITESAAPPKRGQGGVPEESFEDHEIAEAEEPDPELLRSVKLNLDATGFDHALRMLEGIGADGKGWIERHARA